MGNTLSRCCCKRPAYIRVLPDNKRKRTGSGFAPLMGRYELFGILIQSSVRIVDGDTIEGQLHGIMREKLRVFRFADIDTPERDQPFGDKATHMLKLMIDPNTVPPPSDHSLARTPNLLEITVYVDREQETGRFGRTLAHLTATYNRRSSVGVHTVWIQLALIKAGLAWLYRPERKSIPEELRRAEAVARMQRVGLWADDNPIEPRKWRKGQRN